MKIQKEETNLPRSIIFSNVKQDTTPQTRLSLIKYGDIESYIYNPETSTVQINFFSYLDLYLTSKDLQSKGIDFELGPIDPIQLNFKYSHECGATRAVQLQNVTQNKEYFEQLAVRFGPIEEVVYIEAINKEDSSRENINNHENYKENSYKDNIYKEALTRKDEIGNIAIIKFLSILSALKFGKYCHSNPEIRARLSFAKDDCNSNNLINDGQLVDSFYTKNRTIYLGGITGEITAEDIFDNIKGGNILALKILREKKCAFVTFYSHHSANAFFSRYENEDLVIKNNRIRVNRGKDDSESRDGKGPSVPFSTILMCYSGATRALLLYNGDGSLSDDKLRTDLCKFGEIEMINFIENKNIVFVNFCTMADCFNAHLNCRNDSFYKNHRVAFGKDRCNNENYESIMKKVIARNKRVMD